MANNYPVIGFCRSVSRPQETITLLASNVSTPAAAGFLFSRNIPEYDLVHVAMRVNYTSFSRQPIDMETDAFFKANISAQ
jgi:hypothetical protein